MFIPMTLRDAVREVRVVDEDGSSRPLVLSEEVIAPARAAVEPDEPPVWWPAYLLIGLLLGGAAWGIGVRARTRTGARVALAALPATVGLGALALVAGLGVCAGVVYVLGFTLAWSPVRPTARCSN